MAALTVDVLKKMMETVKAIAPGPSTPISLHGVPHWPKEYAGDEIYSYAGHPFWQWLRRTFGIGYGISMQRGRPMMRDRPMVLDRKAGRMYGSEAQMFAVRAELMARGAIEKNRDWMGRYW